MAARRSQWKRVLPTATLTVFPFTALAPSAQAFFPPVSPPPPPVTVVSPPPLAPPVIVVPPVVPPVSPPPFVSPPPTTPPVVVSPPPCDCSCSHTVPEPSTLIAGIAGLTTAAGWTARRRKKGQSE